MPKRSFLFLWKRCLDNKTLSLELKKFFHKIPQASLLSKCARFFCCVTFTVGNLIHSLVTALGVQLWWYFPIFAPFGAVLLEGNLITCRSLLNYRPDPSSCTWASLERHFCHTQLIQIKLQQSTSWILKLSKNEPETAYAAAILIFFQHACFFSLLIQCSIS